MRSGDSGRGDDRGRDARGHACGASPARAPASNSWPAPSKTCTSAPARRRSTSRAWCAACSGSSTRAPGAASGTWKRCRLTARPRLRRRARPTRRRCARGVPDAAKAARTGGTSPRSRPERTRAPPGARRACELAARARRAAAPSGWRARGRMRAAGTATPPSRAHDVQAHAVQRGVRREAAVASGSMSDRDDGSGAEAARGHCQEPRARADVEHAPERAARRRAPRALPGRAASSRGCRCRRRGRGTTISRSTRTSGRLPAGDDLEAARHGRRGSPRGSAPPSRPPARVPPRWRSTGQRAPELVEVGIVAEVGQEHHAALALGFHLDALRAGVPEGGRGFVFTGRVDDHAQRMHEASRPGALSRGSPSSGRAATCPCP